MARQNVFNAEFRAKSERNVFNNYKYKCAFFSQIQMVKI